VIIFQTVTSTLTSRRIRMRRIATNMFAPSNYPQLRPTNLFQAPAVRRELKALLDKKTKVTRSTKTFNKTNMSH
jgi:hypothetical protein